MAVRVSVDLPDDFVREMGLAAAVKWFELGVLSQLKTAQVAGVTRRDFLDALSRFKVSPFQTTPDEFRDDLNCA